MAVALEPKEGLQSQVSFHRLEPEHALAWRFFRYLEAMETIKPGRMVDRMEFQRFAYDEGKRFEDIKMACDELEEVVNVAFSWNTQKRTVEYRVVPMTLDDRKFQKELLDEFERMPDKVPDKVPGYREKKTNKRAGTIFAPAV